MEIIIEKDGETAFCEGFDGCDTQTILGFKDGEAVRENTRTLCTIFKPGGAYVFCQVHNIMGNVPPQSISAMFDEAYKNSFYSCQEINIG